MRISAKVTGLDNLISKVDKLSKNVSSGMDSVLDQIAEYGKIVAEDNFSSAQLMDSHGVPKTPSVAMSVEKKADERRVIADGEDAVYSEYGVGVYHNTNSEALDLDKGIDPWGFHTNNPRDKAGHSLGYFDKWAKKHGSEPSRAMHIASREMEQEGRRLIKEVFND